jgi:hypothetical protein
VRREALKHKRKGILLARFLPSAAEPYAYHMVIYNICNLRDIADISLQRKRKGTALFAETSRFLFSAAPAEQA